MNFKRILPLVIASSFAVSCVACDDSSSGKDDSCKCADGTACPDGDQAKCTAPAECKCGDNSACPENDATKCSVPPAACKCSDGSACPEGNKDKCAAPQDCKCSDGSACPEGNKDKCAAPQDCKCSDGSACPEGNKDKCSAAPEECKCSDGSACPEGNKDKCSAAPEECKCSDGSACPEGDKGKCSAAPEECKCSDGSACPEGNKDKCSAAPEECKCSDGSACPEGNKDKCSAATEECKCPDGSACPEGNETKCKISGDADVDELLAVCAFSSVAKRLETAYKANSKDPEIAFQRSIIGLMNLLHHEKIQAILKDLGFEDNNVNFDTFLWDKYGIFRQMVSEEKDFESVIENAPHKYYTDDIPFKKTISKNITFANVLDAFLGTKETILSLADSFETAAKGLDAKKVYKIEKAGCSLNKIGFTSADLYAIAAVLKFMVSGMHLASAYDLNIKIYDLIDKWPDYSVNDYRAFTAKDASYNSAKIEMENACKKYTKAMESLFTSYITKVTDQTKAKAGREYFVDGVRLLGESVKVAADTPKGSFIGWNSFKGGINKDISDIITKVVASNKGENEFEIMHITPAVKGNLKKLYDEPLHHEFNAYCEVMEHEYGSANYYIEASYDALDYDELSKFFAVDAIKAMTGSEIFYQTEEDDEDGDKPIKVKDEYSHDFSSQWEDLDFDNVFNPNGYFYEEDK